MFDRYLDAQSIEMFESTGVMARNELVARNEVKWEMYTKKIQIEARVMGDLTMNHICLLYTSLDLYRFRHRLFNGQMSHEVRREIFERGHAAVLLPFDPVPVSYTHLSLACLPYSPFVSRWNGVKATISSLFPIPDR